MKKEPTALSTASVPTISQLEKEYHQFIVAHDHPCIMAQSVFKMGAVELHSYNSFGTKKTARNLVADIQAYVDGYDWESNDFVTFLAVFPTAHFTSETAFEKQLWEQLQHIHESDTKAWDETVSNNPEDDTFSFSIAGKAFYIVGMHPNSSRIARQTPYVTLAFNLHWQFEKLRKMGSYDTVKQRIRERDKALQGSINPMLEDFGSSSEARQYSGRKTEKEWKCPFHHTS
ncbi:guanitoxin biosynthesis heme-dependent pre-guanitoxin N-hydroxylase GntA [Marixanthomonas spongiae]|uniref:YqcI/YcgG family protein n=1 Tax=Marixanthomonas spongiae TaxID=2174845 RepID=A0A2U0I563_9FLAO|nr:guanitoxin biosynthesis heme-dependent pre-guanitoxin N-hydroxylase GntA [Marixanthomonas spongiae]PVW16248.1 YqcI/YcgG family protein [Marixanthomonas spongiae]